MMWWLPLAGALGGALLDKKNRGRGALLGGMAGAAPGLLGSAGAVTVPANMGVAEAAAWKAGAHGLGQAATQTTGAKAMGLLTQAGQAAGAAQQVAGMMPEEAPPMPGQLQARPGPDDSGFLAMQTQQRQMDEEEKRMRQMLQNSYVQRLLGGGNGLA